MSEQNKGGVVARRNVARSKPVANSARAAASGLRHELATAQPGNDVVEGHVSANLTTTLSKGKSNDSIVGATLDDLHPKAVGRRLRILRFACEMGTQEDAANAIGVDRQRWANWEQGVALPPAQYVQQLTLRFPEVCFNYLFLGRSQAMSLALCERIVRGSVAANARATPKLKD